MKWVLQRLDSFVGAAPAARVWVQQELQVAGCPLLKRGICKLEYWLRGSPAPMLGRSLSLPPCRAARAAPCCAVRRQLREENRGLEGELEEAKMREKEARDESGAAAAQLARVRVRGQCASAGAGPVPCPLCRTLNIGSELRTRGVSCTGSCAARAWGERQ